MNGVNVHKHKSPCEENTKGTLVNERHGRSRPESLYVIESPYGPMALNYEEMVSALELARDVSPARSEESVAEGEQCAEQLLDADAAARALGVKPSWLLQRAREGRIHHVKLGKYIRFDVERIRAEGGREPW